MCDSRTTTVFERSFTDFKDLFGFETVAERRSARHRVVASFACAERFGARRNELELKTTLMLHWHLVSSCLRSLHPDQSVLLEAAGGLSEWDLVGPRAQ